MPVTCSLGAGGASSFRSETVASQVEIENLRAEVAKLKEENSLLRDENLRLRSLPAHSEQRGNRGSRSNATQVALERHAVSRSGRNAIGQNIRVEHISDKNIEEQEDEIWVRFGGEAREHEFDLSGEGSGEGGLAHDDCVQQGVQLHGVSDAASISERPEPRTASSVKKEAPPPTQLPPAKPFMLTKEQKNAALVAESMQRQIDDAAEAAPERVKTKVGEYWATHCGGPALESMLGDGADLIDAQFLIALANAGGVLPRAQDVPDVARITPDRVWRLRCWNDPYRLPVLVLSCPWLDANHPDRLGEQLKRLTPIFQAFVDECKTYGPHATAGVLWDYCALPQMPYADELVDAQRFERGRREMHKWYSHPHTFVLMVTTLPSRKTNSVRGSKYSMMHGFYERGWPAVERRLGSLVKSSGRLLDLSKYNPDGVASFDLLQKQLKATRPALMSPERLGKQLRESVANGEVVFSLPSDLDVVVQLYTRGFVWAIENFSYNRTSVASKSSEVFLRNLGWGEAEANDVIEALKFAADHCVLASERVFHLFQGNAFSEESKASMRAVCEGSKLKVVD